VIVRGLANFKTSSARVRPDQLRARGDNGGRCIAPSRQACHMATLGILTKLPHFAPDGCSLERAAPKLTRVSETNAVYISGLRYDARVIPAGPHRNCAQGYVRDRWRRRKRRKVVMPELSEFVCAKTEDRTIFDQSQRMASSARHTTNSEIGNTLSTLHVRDRTSAAVTPRLCSDAQLRPPTIASRINNAIVCQKHGVTVSAGRVHDSRATRNWHAYRLVV
jgi:hypothetical protein